MVRQELRIIIRAETAEKAADMAERIASAALDAAEDGPYGSVRIMGHGATINWQSVGKSEGQK